MSKTEEKKEAALQGRLSLSASTVLNIRISTSISSNSGIDKSITSTKVLKYERYLRMEVETGSLGPVWKKTMK